MSADDSVLCDARRVLCWRAFVTYFDDMRPAGGATKRAQRLFSAAAQSPVAISECVLPTSRTHEAA